MIISFFLVLTDAKEAGSIWLCSSVKPLSAGHRNDLAFVTANSVCLADENSNNGIVSECEARHYILAPRHAGCSVFSSEEWPVFVYVMNFSESIPFEIPQRIDLRVDCWGEVYPTLHAAQARKIPCQEKNYAFSFDAFRDEIPLSIEIMWVGFTYGYVGMDAVEDYFDYCMQFSDTQDVERFLPFYTAFNISQRVSTFRDLAFVSKPKNSDFKRMEKVWSRFANKQKKQDKGKT